MPRPSKFADPHVDGVPARLEPPLSLSPAERDVFVSLVASIDRKHLHASDLPLVVNYVRAIALEQRAAGELAKDPVNTRWLALWEKASRQMTASAARLRLSPQSRQSARAAGREPTLVARPWE